MIETGLVILIHQFVFQGMFVTKNIVLRNKIRKQIRGNNKEATISIAFFVLFIVVALVMSILKPPVGQILVLDRFFATISGVVLLLLNLAVSAASLVNLKDSWRVGVIENQKTDLISSGIYRFTRNPYFLSYLLMFLAYTVILQNIILLGLSIFNFIFIHKMILREEKYLYAVHGADYIQYKRKVPRYIFI